MHYAIALASHNNTDSLFLVIEHTLLLYLIPHECNTILLRCQVSRWRILLIFTYPKMLFGVESGRSSAAQLRAGMMVTQPSNVLSAPLHSKV